MCSSYQQKSQRLAVPSMGKRVEKQGASNTLLEGLTSPHQKTLGMSKKGEDAHTPQVNNPTCRQRPWREPHVEVPEDTAKGSAAKSATLKRGDTDVSSAVGR